MRKLLFILCFISVLILNFSGCEQNQRESDSTKQKNDSIKQKSESKQNIESHIIDSLLIRYNDGINRIPDSQLLIYQNNKKYKKENQKFWKDFEAIGEQLVNYWQNGKMSPEQVKKYKLLGEKHNKYLNLW